MELGLFANFPRLPNDPLYGCGYGALRTGEDDPFLRACVVHDYRYEQHEFGTEYEPYDRERADEELMSNMLRLAGDDAGLKIRAYLYYGLVRVFGWLAW